MLEKNCQLVSFVFELFDGSTLHAAALGGETDDYMNPKTVREAGLQLLKERGINSRKVKRVFAHTISLELASLFVASQE